MRSGKGRGGGIPLGPLMPLKWASSQDFEQSGDKIYLRMFFCFCFLSLSFPQGFKRISQDVLLRIDCRGVKTERRLIRMIGLSMVIDMVK